MGGAVFVGVKLPDGREVLWDEWTNIIPERTSLPHFWDMGKDFQNFVSSPKPDNEWPHPKTLTEIEPSEYGVILIDCIAKKVLSRQDYTSVGGILVITADAIDMFSEMIRNKRVSRIKAYYPDRDPCMKNVYGAAALNMAKTLILELRSKGHIESCQPRVYVKTHDFKIDEGSDRACYPDTWKEILAWLNKHSWASPRWSLERIVRDRES